MRSNYSLLNVLELKSNHQMQFSVIPKTRVSTVLINNIVNIEIDIRNEHKFTHLSSKTFVKEYF